MDQNDSRKLNMNERLKSILDAALKYFDAEMPYIYYPSYTPTDYPDNVQGMESFARLLWGACFADDQVLDKEKKRRLMKAVAIGTDKNSVYYWGDLTDYSQLAVEMTPVAFFVYLNKGIFDALNEKERENISAWLNQINNVKLYENNWQCFIVLVNLFLQLSGCKYSADKKKEALKKIEGMYAGEGWYSDGNTRQFDYYVSFAIHFYLLIYNYYSPKDEETQVYLDRSLLFSKSFVYWFADDGAGLPFGRSLTYKFAQSAFWAALAMNDVSAEVKALAGGILFRNLDWWFEREVIDRNGLLVLGYAYPNQQFIEFYNASGSSYWALKSFLFLIIPDNDDFWGAHEEKKSGLNNRQMIAPAGMVVCRDKGNPYAFVNGQRAVYDFGHTECKYEKFVYSTKSGFCISRSNKSTELLAPDSTVAISLNGEDYISRSNYEVVKTEENCLISRWKPAKRIEITTVILPAAPGHIRMHLIDTGEEIVFVDGGFSLSKDGVSRTLSNGCLLAKNNDTLSGAGSLLGSGEAFCIDAVPGANLLYKHCVIPAVKYDLTPGKYKVIDWFYLGEDDKEALENSRKYKLENELLLYGNDRLNVAFTDLSDYRAPGRCASVLKKAKRLMKTTIR